MVGIFKWVLLHACACIFVFTPSLSAAQHKAKVKVQEWGYFFNTVHKIYFPPSCRVIPSSLLVNVTTSNRTSYIRGLPQHLPKNILSIDLEFTLDNTPKHVHAMCSRKREGIIEKNIKSTSLWYPGIQKLLNIIGSNYYKSKGKIKLLKIAHPKKASSFRIKSLPLCKLNTEYSINIKEHNASSIYVKVLTEAAAQKEGGIVITATFNNPNNKSSSKVQLVKTKSFKVVECVNIDSDSLLLHEVRKVMKRSVAKYEKLKHIHDKIMKKRDFKVAH